MIHRRTRTFAVVVLILSLILSACSILGDDEDPTATPDTSNVTMTETVDVARETTSETSTLEESTGQDAGETATVSEEGAATTATENSSTAIATAGTPETDTDAAGDLTTRVEEVTAEVRPAVAFIAITQFVQQPTGQQGEQQGVGSGVIFDDEGHILTNNHVVENADELQVVLPDGRQFDASVLGRAPKQDLAIIQIEGEDLPVAHLAESGDLEIGQWVIAIGNALGLEGGASVTVGVVSALDRSIRPSQNEPAIEGLIQTDAAINPGNSGGPLVNLDGEVVGINTAKIPQAEGIGFAIPIDTVQTIIDQILNGEAQATLGVSVGTVTPEVAVRFNLPTNSGVVVIDIDFDGPADTAGIEVGDIITEVDGQAVETVDELRSALQTYEPGDTVTVTVNRGGQVQDIDVELGESIVIR